MATVDELKVKITADTSQYEKSISRVKSSLNGLAKTIGAAFSITALTAFTKSCLKAASDLEEVQNVVDVAFGSMSKDAEEFAANSIRAFGITELQAKQVGSTFMAMANAIGLSKKNATAMSLSLTALAADMSSFYNVSLGTAQTALEGIFTGYGRALRQFGVVLDENTLEEYRLAQGIEKAYTAMTVAEKVTLRYNYAMTALSQAQGDYARTSGSWANQIRLLTNQFNQLKVALGTILRGVLGPILVRLNQILARIVSIAQAVATLFGKGTENVGTYAQEVENVGIGFDDATASAKEFQKTVAGFDELNRLSPPPSEAGGGGGIGPIEAMGDIDLKPLEYAETTVNNISDSLQSIGKTLEWLKTLLIVGIIGGALINMPQLITNIGKVFSSLGDYVWLFGNSLFEAFSPGKWKAAFAVLSGGFKSLFKEIGDFFGALGGDALTGGWTAAVIAGIIALIMRIRELWNTSEEFRTRASNVWETIQNGIKRIISAFNPLWECLENLFKTIQALWKDCVAPAVNSILDIVIAAGLDIGELLGNLMAGPLGDLIAIVANIASIVVDAINIILQAVSPAIQSIAGAWLPLVSAGIQALFELITIGVNWVVSAISVFTNAWRTAFEAVHNFVHKMAESITTAFGNIRQGIKDAINSAIYWIETGINNIINRINNSGIVTAINRFTGWSIGINPIYIPRLASGGVINSPTVAMMGEYSNARSNPEIVAPQSIMRETMDAANAELASVYAQIGRQIIQAIEQKDLEVSIGDTTIAKSAARGNRQYQLATGVSLF